MGIIKLQFLKEITKGNEKLMKEMLEEILNLELECLNQMEADLKIKDWASVSGTAHKLKSSVKIVDAEPFVSRLIAIEFLIKGFDYHEAETVLNEIKSLSVAFKKELAEIIAGYGK